MNKAKKSSTSSVRNLCAHVSDHHMQSLDIIQRVSTPLDLKSALAEICRDGAFETHTKGKPGDAAATGWREIPNAAESPFDSEFW